MKNDMRDRLVSLLNVAVGDSNLTYNEVKIVADYLIANGVIVPPCKVGNTVWFCSEYAKEIFELKVIGFEHDIERGLYLRCENKTNFSVEKQLGKTLFLTRDQAEQKLKEMRDDNG